MQKQLSLFILAGAMFGVTSQLNAMKEDLAIVLHTTRNSSSNALQNLLPNNLSTQLSCQSDNRFTHVSEVRGKVRRYAYAKNLNIATNDTPKAFILFGLRDNELGFGIYKGTVGDHTMTFMKFVPFKLSTSDYREIQEKDLLPKARELLEEALRELEASATQNNK